MIKASSLMSRLGLSSPVIQAPMAGGSDSPALAAAVSAAGGLGSLGCAYLTANQIGAAAQAIKARTDRPFALNLFAPLPDPGPADATRALAAMAPYFESLGLPAPEAPKPPAIRFEDQAQAVLESGAAVFSFTFGIPAAVIPAFKARGVLLIGTATTVAEALALEAAGVDAIVVQGAEAGGHRGAFLAPVKESLIGTMALTPQVVDAVSVPVIASGGIMDGRGIAAALVLGAQAVQMGTAFLTCDEAGASAAYRAALTASDETSTGLTRAFSGRSARGLVNRVTREVGEDAILPFPLQNQLTRPMRTEATRQGKADYLSMWAGQGLRTLRALPAAELMAALERETKAAIAGLG